MDHARFDRLTQLLAAPNSRRTLLGGTIGVALLGAIGSAEGDARRKRHKARARQNVLREAQGFGSDCAQFCRHLPPGPGRGACLQECLTGSSESLFNQCWGDPMQICTAVDGTTTCCGTGACFNNPCRTLTCPAGCLIGSAALTTSGECRCMTFSTCARRCRDGSDCHVGKCVDGFCLDAPTCQTDEDCVLAGVGDTCFTGASAGCGCPAFNLCGGRCPGLPSG
jgi:hypothetical protein